MFLRRSTLLLLAVLFAGLLLGGVAAGRPPKPPAEQVDKGFIYFDRWVPTDGSVLMRMLPDGAQKTTVPLPSAQILEPSFLLHGGLQWHLLFCAIEGETYPDGRQRLELFAASETGLYVQVTDDPTVEPVTSEDGSPWYAHARWANDGSVIDGKVSFNGRRWEGGDVTEAGIYAASLDPDLLGTGFAPVPPTLQPVSPPLRDIPTWGSGFNGSYAWSPDGSAVVFDSSSTPDCCGLRIQTLGGPVTVLTTDSASYPRWSNVRSGGGSLIAFRSALGIEVIQPDGAGRRALVSDTVSREFRWSPSGAYLAYGLTPTRRMQATNIIVFRIHYSGSGNTRLTGDLDWCDVRGWPKAE